MILKVDRMINTFMKVGISGENRVMKPSKKPAANVKGKVLKNILKESLNPILKD